MNERIDQLWGQALDLAVPETYTRLSYNQVLKIKQVFAELIVRDVVEQIITRERTDGEWYQDDIFKHFGVEEQQKVAPKPKCSVCGTTENVKYMGGYQPYLCDSEDCIPF